MKSLTGVACALLLSLLFAGPLAAQVSMTGHVLGQVVSEEGSPIPGATVELDGEITRRVQTDSEGEFGFIAVPAGSYTITATQVGYHASTPLAVEVAPAQTQRVILTVAIAPVEIEGIEAISSGITITTEDTDFGSEISETQIDLLPVSYNPNDLVALTPGVRPGHVWGGATAQANNYQLDGITANHPGLGGDLIQPSINWIESIEVKGLGAGAQYGNFQGGLVNVITKTGSNDFQGAFYSNLESHALNGTNLVATEIGSEIESRYNLELEVRGPIVTDHLFYFLAGQRVLRDAQYVNHRPEVESRFSPVTGERTESKYFGKITWLPGDSDILEGSFGWLNNVEGRFGNTGYETAEATLLLEEPTRFYNLSWQRQWTENLSLDAKLASYTVDRSRTPYNGDDAVGVLTFGLLPPNLAFQNAPLRFNSEVASLAGSLDWTLDFSTWGWNHSVIVGGERSLGSFIDQRLRNGGMTWRPPRLARLEGGDPSTWFFSSAEFVPTAWGGEVNLDSEVVNDAIYMQSNFQLGSRVNVSPGLRWGHWLGRLTPVTTGETFTAVEDEAYDPRLGLTLDLTGTASFVAKAHWGRYHQSMIGQFFDRAEGGGVFTNEQTWYYRGPRFDDPRLRFTTEERDLLAESGQFTLESEIILNETGPVVNYRQPYVDQWVVGLEKTLGSSVKIEAVYVNRRNRDMVALVDRNRETNYTLYEYVIVTDASGQALPFSGGNVQLRKLYLPNSVLLERLRHIADCPDCGGMMPPGLTLADTLNLTWSPDYALTNAPGATRKFDQIQLAAEFSRPTWGANASLVWTDLRGNLDNVTGYDDPSGYGAGPYVRVNEATNSFGKLSNYSERVFKVSLHGQIAWGISGGLFYTAAQGDHYSPTFTLSGTGLYRYEALNGGPIDPGFLNQLEEHNVFVGPRGFPQNRPRKLLDVHLERELNWFGGGVNLSLDVFNLFNTKTVTDVNTSVNYGRNFYHFLPGGGSPGVSRFADANEYYKATLQRVPPRTVRIGTVIRF